MAERHSAQLRGVGHCDDPLRGFGGGALHSGLGEKVGCHAGLEVDTAGPHHARVEPELRKRMLGEPSGQRQLPRADLTSWEEKFDARTLVQFENGPQSEWHDGQSPVSQRSSDLHRRRPAVEDHRLPIREEVRGSFAYRQLGFPGIESPNAVRGFLGTQENTRRPTVHPAQASAALQGLKVAPYRHLRAIQYGGQLADQHRAAFMERPHDQLLACLHIHAGDSNINNVSSHRDNVRPPVEAVIFDVGGVLLDWNPRYLYRKLVSDQATMERFLAEVCTPAWHANHDRGVSTAASCSELASSYPEFSELDLGMVEAQRGDDRWCRHRIGKGPPGGKETELPCYALTNMEAETYPLRLWRFPFLGWFDGTVVSGSGRSGEARARDLHAILDRFGLTARTTLMIDDTEENLDTASKLGMQAVRFSSSAPTSGTTRGRGDPLTIFTSHERRGRLMPRGGR